jgi:hypothetical protein
VTTQTQREVAHVAVTTQTQREVAHVAVTTQTQREVAHVAVTAQTQREVAHVTEATQLIVMEFSISMFRVQIILEVQEGFNFTCYLLIV